MQYTVTLQMKQEVIEYMSLNKYQLYAFKGIVTANPTATPTVWLCLPVDDKFGTVKAISWNSSLFIGKCSETATPSGATISDKSPWPDLPGQPIVLGKAYTYDEKDRWNSTPVDKKRGEVLIQNHVTHGISNYYVSSSNTVTGTESPIIIVDVIPDGSVSFSPIETVAFIFASEKYDAGTLMLNAFSGGAVVTFAGAENNAIITYNPKASGWEAVQLKEPTIFKKFRSGEKLYDVITNSTQQALTAAIDQLEGLLLSQRRALATLKLHSSPVEVNGSGWCTCNEDGTVTSNKCKSGYKPKCDGSGGCDCVSKG